MKRLFLLTLILCSSCATPQYIWLHPNYNDGDFNKDTYQCQQDAMIFASSSRQSSSTPAMANPLATVLFGETEVNYQFRFKQCMQVKGYTLTQK